MRAKKTNEIEEQAKRMLQLQEEAQKKQWVVTLAKESTPVKKADVEVEEAGEEKKKPTKTKTNKKAEIKLVREGLLLPEEEAQSVNGIRARSFTLGINASKTMVYRVGLLVLSEISDVQLKKALERLTEIKPGKKGG